jgi:hypothetical protein
LGHGNYSNKSSGKQAPFFHTKKKNAAFLSLFPLFYKLSSPSTGIPLLNPPVLQDKTHQWSHNRVDDQLSLSLRVIFVMVTRGSLLSSCGLASISLFLCQNQNCSCSSCCCLIRDPEWFRRHQRFLPSFPPPPSFRNKLKQYLSSLNPLPVIDRPDSRNFEIKFRLVFFFFGLYYELLASRFLNPSRLSGERYWIQITFNWHPHSMFDY